MQRLKKRAEFLAVARGARTGRRAFSLQAAPLGEAEPRVGFTVTKKVGNSPERNRIRRRLREAVRQLPPEAPAADQAYVIVGRREALAIPFAALVADLRSAMQQLARQRSTPRAAGVAPKTPRTPPTTPAGET